MNCAICGKPMKLIPAGVSKSTGNAYNSFYACEDKSHKQPRNQAPAYPPKVAPVATQAPRTEVDWDKVSLGKCKHAYLVEAFKANLGNPNIKLSEIEAIAEEWARASMRILPTKQAQSLEQSLARQGVELPPMPEEDEVTVENIPF